MLRGLMGLGLVYGALGLLSAAIDNSYWYWIAERATEPEREPVGELIGGFARQMSGELLAGALAVFLLSQVLLLWPPRQANQHAAPAAREV